MRLAELEPEFLRISPPEKTLGKLSFEMVDFAQADGVMFLCPVCFVANSGRDGTHQIICWRPHVPQTIEPIPGRWEFEGNGAADLSLVAGSSSVHLTKSPCGAHFFVRGGEIVLA